MNPQDIVSLDPDAITQETAIKLLLAGVGGAAVAGYAVQGLRTMKPEQRQQVTLFAGAMMLAWGIKSYFDVSKELDFLFNAEAEPPASWAELQAALAKQAQKAGL